MSSAGIAAGTADERRAIERGLRNGETAAAVSTNALELGIDIGSLDVCIMTGYSGAWRARGSRRAARAGDRAFRWSLHRIERAARSVSSITPNTSSINRPRARRSIRTISSL